MTASIWRLGDLEIRPAERRVLRAGAPRPLGGRAFDLLLVLLEQRGSVLSKGELLRRVWPGLVVEDNNLTVHMSALRKALGAEAIVTVAGRGYQLNGEFVAVTDAAADDSAAPAAAAPKPLPGGGNLPAASTRCLGRAAERAAALAALLEARLVTLTGTGGIGKTTLALNVAAAAAPGFADGAWWVELASVVHADALLPALAGALALPQQAGKTMLESLVEALRRRQALLVLDNCEHLIDGVASLAHALLAGCPRLVLLATSREALMVAGERALAVPALGVASSQSGQAGPAVELFVERARGVAADFAADAHGAAVSEICRRLDGIPLAIELAAARVRSLSPQQICDRLDQRFALLTSAPRGSQARHQTLRQAVRWSYDLLSPAERAVLARSAVFVGGFTLEAAEQVCSGPDLQATEVLDLLDSLARKSMLVVDRTSTVTRFAMLETIRQFAAERLVEDREAAGARRSHARLMAAASDRQFALWRSPRQREAHAWLDQEIGNLRVAFRWAMQQADVDVAARIASNVGDMARHCLRDEASGWAAEVLPAARRARHRRLCVLLNWAGSAACGAASFDDARRHATEALALADDPDFDPLVWAAVDLAFVELAAGEVERALEWLRRGAAHPADAIDRYCAACLFAIAASGPGVDEARGLAEPTLRSVDATGVPCSIVVAHVGQGELLADADPPGALAEMELAIATARASGCRFLESYFTPRLAVLQALHGEPLAALRILERLGQAWAVSTDAAVLAAWRAGIVVVLARLQRAQMAATLHGALDAAMQGTALLPHLDHAVAQARAALGEAAFARAQRLGRAMDTGDADDYARRCLQQSLAAIATAA